MEFKVTAFFVVTTAIKDPEKFQEYGAKAGQTFAPYGGKLVMRGKAEQALAGEVNHQGVSIVGFPDMDALNSWYQSAEYQALIPLRDEAVDMTLITYNEPT